MSRQFVFEVPCELIVTVTAATEDEAREAMTKAMRAKREQQTGDPSPECDFDVSSVLEDQPGSPGMLLKAEPERAEYLGDDDAEDDEASHTHEGGPSGLCLYCDKPTPEARP